MTSLTSFCVFIVNFEHISHFLDACQCFGINPITLSFYKMVKHTLVILQQLPQGYKMCMIILWAVGIVGLIWFFDEFFLGKIKCLIWVDFFEFIRWWCDDGQMIQWQSCTIFHGTFFLTSLERNFCFRQEAVAVEYPKGSEDHVLRCSLFFKEKIGFTPCKAEQPQGGIELQEI